MTGVPLLLLGALHGAVVQWRPRWVRALLLLDLLLVGWESAGLAPFYFGLRFDTWMHLAIVRRIVEHGIFPPDPFYRGQGAAPLTSLVHYAYAAAALASGRPIAELWRWGTPIAAMGVGAAVYFAHRELFRVRTAALLATVFYLAWQRETWAIASYPRSLVPLFYFLALGLLWRARGSSGGGTALGAGAALGLAYAAHPVGGAAAVLGAGAAAAGETATRAMAGEGRAAVRAALRMALGAAMVGGPFLAIHAGAWHHRVGTAPVVHREFPGLAHFLSEELGLGPRPDLRLLVLWGAPVLLGAARLLARSADRRIVAYVASTTLLGWAVLGSPATGPLLGLFGPPYLARFAMLLPLPALAALGLSLAVVRRPAAGPSGVAVAGAAAVALYLAALLASVPPWQPPFSANLPRGAARPDLEALEPLLHERVVLTDRRTAYVLPHFTGAYVAANAQDHSNPWLHDPVRLRGARQILAGRAAVADVRRYCDRYGVEFVLLPAPHAAVARGPLLGSGYFRERDAPEGLVLLERTAPPAPAASPPRVPGPG